MSDIFDAIKQYHDRDRPRFWILIVALFVLLGEFVCTILIVVEESIIISSITTRKYSEDDLWKCRMYTPSMDGNDTIPIDSAQRRVLFWAQLISHTLADCQLLFTLCLAIRSIHVERGFRTHVLFVFPFSWTWASSITLLSWPYLPVLASTSVAMIQKCTVARFLFIVGLCMLSGALIIFAMAFGAWRRHESKVLKLVARRQTQTHRSTDDDPSNNDVRYRTTPRSQHPTIDRSLNDSSSSQCQSNGGDGTTTHQRQQPYYVACPFSPQLAQSNLSEEQSDYDKNGGHPNGGYDQKEEDTYYRDETLPIDEQQHATMF